MFVDQELRDSCSLLLESLECEVPDLDEFLMEVIADELVGECKQTGKPGPCAKNRPEPPKKGRQKKSADPDAVKAKGKGADGQGEKPKDKPGFFGRIKGAVSKAKEVGGRWGDKVGNLPGIKQVKGTASKVMGGVKDKLAKRYGEKVASGIMGGGFLGGYGVAALAVAKLGFTVPVVSDVVAIGALTAVAEVGKQLGFIKSPSAEGYVREQDLDFDDLPDIDDPETQEAVGEMVWDHIVESIMGEIEANKEEINNAAVEFADGLGEDELKQLKADAQSLMAE